MPMEGYVYLVHALGTKRYKIGQTRDVDKRMETLQRCSPFPLKLLSLLQTNDFVLQEKRLHKIACSYRVHGEWFELPSAWLENLKLWFYDTNCQNYKHVVIPGNLAILVKNRTLSEPPTKHFPSEQTTQEEIQRAVSLLGSLAKGAKFNKKVRRELYNILGHYPSTQAEAMILKLKLQEISRELKARICY